MVRFSDSGYRLIKRPIPHVVETRAFPTQVLPQELCVARFIWSCDHGFIDCIESSGSMEHVPLLQDRLMPAKPWGIFEQE